MNVKPKTVEVKVKDIDVLEITKPELIDAISKANAQCVTSIMDAAKEFGDEDMLNFGFVLTSWSSMLTETLVDNLFSKTTKEYKD